MNPYGIIVAAQGYTVRHMKHIMAAQRQAERHMKHIMAAQDRQ